MKTSVIRTNGVRDGTENKVISNYAVEFTKNEFKKHKSEIPIDHPDGSVTLEKLSDDVKNEFAQLQKNIDSEARERIVSDNEIKQKLDIEIDTRENEIGNIDIKVTNYEKEAYKLYNSTVTTMERHLTAEADNRQTADNDLQQKITAETTARKTADIALIDRITAVEEKAHTHTNKTVLDGITEERVTTWDGIKEQVTQTQLDEAIAAEAAARENADHVLQGNIDAEAAERAASDAAETTARTEADNAIIAMLNAAKAYLEDMCFGFTDEFQRVYAAIGIAVYDGGIFGMEQNDIALDGGDFTDEVTGTVDCGGFEPIIISTETGALIDGGTFDSVATTTIDGGTY